MSALAMLGEGSDRTRAHGAEVVRCPDLRGDAIAIVRCERRQASEAQCGLRCPLARAARDAAGALREMLRTETEMAQRGAKLVRHRLAVYGTSCRRCGGPLWSGNRSGYHAECNPRRRMSRAQREADMKRGVL